MSMPACVVELLETVAVDGASCWWLGERHALTDGEEDGPLAVVRGLAGRLYADFYVTGGVAPPLPGHTPRAALSRPEPDLSSSNTGTGSPQLGWTIAGSRDESVVVERAGLRLVADRRRVRRGRSGTVVVLPEETLGPPWGFYTAHGDAGTCEADDGRVDRYYWNVRGDARPALLSEVTGRLNRCGLPFRFKVLNDRATARCDAAVLYTEAARRPAVRPVLAEIATSVAAGLRERVPALTKPLAPGLGFAENPPGDESFGTHRCTLIGEALLADRAGARYDGRGVDAIADRFRRAGLSMDRPHLNPGSDPRDDPAPLS